MRRIIICLLACLCLVSCSDTVIENETASSVDNSQEHGYLYVINTNSKKYHTAMCSYAQDIKEEYKKTTSDINFIVEREYTPCSSCIKR